MEYKLQSPSAQADQQDPAWNGTPHQSQQHGLGIFRQQREWISQTETRFNLLDTLTGVTVAEVKLPSHTAGDNIIVRRLLLEEHALSGVSSNGESFVDCR